MITEDLPINVLLVELPCREPRITEQFRAVNDIISKDNNNDVIIDFSKVEIINSSNISNLIILQKMLKDSGHQLFLSQVSVMTKCIFVVAGLTEMFNFVESPDKAFETINH